MTSKERNEQLMNSASKAMRSAIRKVILDRKRRGQPLIVWKDGKVIKLDPRQIP